MDIDSVLQKAAQKPGNLNADELAFLLELNTPEACQKLYQAAYQLKLRYIGNRVSLRGLIEMSNICSKNCFYCGIRRGNSNVERFQLPPEAILRMAKWAWQQHYGSIVLQGGEIESPAHTDFVENLLTQITAMCNGELGITLSLGEQSYETFARWRAAGAHRYLLRIESSSPEFYAALHPADHSWQRRKECLTMLKKLDYQTGSGVMIGLPGQTTQHLIYDLQFFRDMDLDMIGMGPYLPHKDTPLGKDMALTPEYLQHQLHAGLNMIAVTRLFLHNVNIASTTALQALQNNGRELGILAGANVIMPNVTDTEYRKNYQLYARKPAINENSAQSRDKLTAALQAIGEEINWNIRGDSPHYQPK